MESHPLMERRGQTFDQFNQEFKIIKARILKQKLEEAKIQGEAMISSAEHTIKNANQEFNKAFGPLKDKKYQQDMAKKISDQFTQEGKRQVEEATEGLKEIDIYIGMLQKKGRSVHQSGGLAYMLGEPTYMKYGAGGSVGHAPWHKPTGQQQPQPQLDTPAPQVGGAQSPGRGQPNPMKAPRGLPSLAPRTMDPQYMQQQAMQKAMMGQGQGQQRMGMEEGGFTQDDFNQFLKEREEMHREGGKHQLEKDWERYKRFKQYGQGSIQEAAGGGRIGFGLGGINKGRRAFMKWLAGITGTGIAGGAGLLKFGSKAAPKVIKEAEVITRGADGMPKYITDLIEVVKAKGTRDIIEGFKRSDYSTVHSYKGVDVIEDGAGNIKIKKPTEGVATDSTTGKSYEGTSQEVHIEINKGEWIKPTKTKKGIQAPDEYIEGTVRPDRDGKMKDLIEEIDEVDHLELKKIADEIDTLEIPGYDRFSKASGGLAYMLGE